MSPVIILGTAWYVTRSSSKRSARSLETNDRTTKKALDAHYRNGPAQNWQQNYISGYASTHPWEDFAETWAHYLHIVDTLEMAFAFGIHIKPGIDDRAGASVALDFDPHDDGSINRLIEAWLPLTFAVNSIIRCMGEADFYPFLLSPRAIAKMGFVHELVHQERSAFMNDRSVAHQE
jgi:hypothetical protein